MKFSKTWRIRHFRVKFLASFQETCSRFLKIDNEADSKEINTEDFVYAKGSANRSETQLMLPSLRAAHICASKEIPRCSSTWVVN
jgi:hypothetical protein